jgi:hypothetical protein
VNKEELEKLEREKYRLHYNALREKININNTQLQTLVTGLTAENLVSKQIIFVM